MSAEPPDPASLDRPWVASNPPDPASLDRPWVASYPPGVPPTYHLPDVALSRFLDDAARDFPTNEAIVVPGGGSVDNVTLRDRADTLAAALADLGVQPEDRVLVAVPNSQAMPAVLFALWRLGAVAVPIDPEIRADHLVEVVHDAQPAGAIGVRRVLDALLEHDAMPSLAVLADGSEWPQRRRAARVRRLLVPPRVGPLRRATDASDIVKLADLAERDGPHALPAAPDPHAPAMLAYRSPSHPVRGVVLSHANLVANAFQARLWIPDIQAGRERVLVADGLHATVPMTMGLLAGLLSAAAVVVLDDPSPSELGRAIERQRPTLLATSPGRLVELLAEGDTAKRDLGSLRVVLAVGGPVPPEVAAELEHRSGGARVREGYGLAEAGPFTHAQPVYGRVAPGAIGLPVTSTVAAVVDPDDLSCLRPTGEPGLLLVSGPQVASGYWCRDAESAATFVDGWVVTDDLAVVDDDGVFRHVARLDEVIRRDGALVGPRHVEATLERHAEVARAGVVGDDSSGLLLAVVVARRRRPRPDPDELLAHCRTHLDSPAVPDRVTLVDELPQDEDGELDRTELHRDLVGR